MFTMVDKIKQIKIREQEYKKLSDYKVHPKQPFWEVVKNIINNKKEVTQNVTKNQDVVEEIHQEGVS